MTESPPGAAGRPAGAPAALVPPPSSGRIFTGTRRVRFGDVHPGGTARLDALSTYLQDVSSDDTTEVGLAADLVWVVRRTVFEVRVAARFLEQMELKTWCAGLGSHWAERRVSMRGDRGATIEASVLWVCVDYDTGRAVPLPAEFLAHYEAPAAGRKVSARLHHRARPADTDAGAVRRLPWPLRVCDFDLFDHVNNTAAWAMVEEAMGDRNRRAPYRAEIEYRAPVEPGCVLDLQIVDGTHGELDLWAVGPGGDSPTLFTTARWRPLAG
jgi:acyl-ACP thioesterase